MKTKKVLKKWVKVVLFSLGAILLLILCYKLLEKSYNDSLDYCVSQGNSVDYCKKELSRYES